VKPKVLLVLFNRGAFQPRTLYRVDPQLARYGDGYATTVGNVRALDYFDARRGRESIRVFLFLERLEDAIAFLVNVVDDPGFALSTLCGFPFPSTYRHYRLRL
jgi:hypothetical protein